MAKRAAEIASPSSVSPAGGAATTLSAFERQFNAVWGKGKGSPKLEALYDVLCQLPGTADEMVGFVRESLTEELLSGIILASHACTDFEEVGVTARRIAHLSGCKRFDMAWMMIGKAEKAAVSEILKVGKAGVPPAELAIAIKRYGVQMA